MNRDLVIDFIFHQRLSRADIVVADGDYAFPSERFIREAFAPAWKKFLFAFGLDTYRPEKNDCDKFARGAAWFAGLLHARDRKSGNTGLAFGEFHFVRDNGGGHAINAGIWADPVNAPQLFFFEPQTAEIITVSETERRSCTLLKI